MMDFFIDTVGDLNAHEIDKTNTKPITTEVNKSNTAKIKFLDIDNLFTNVCSEPPKTKREKKSDLDQCLDEFYNNMGWERTSNTSPQIPSTNTSKLKPVPISTFGLEKIDVEAVMKKSVLNPDFDRLKHIAEYDPSEKKLKKERRLERSKTKGKNWFNLPATELTEEVKRDLEVLKMRSALDPKHFYKKNDLSVLPKYFQIGKVVDSPIDFYNGRLTNKQRKSTLVEELLADAEFSRYNKKKYKEIMEQRSKLHYKRGKKNKNVKQKTKK